MNPYYRDEALEAIARKVVSLHDPCLLDTPAPIPVEIIMESVYGLALEFQYIRKNGRVLGETVFEDAMVPIYKRGNGRGYNLVPVKAGTVIIDASLINCQGNGRFRYTCAHELSHWVIHKEYYMRLGETAAMTKSSEADDTVEKQANRLASYILMPKGTVKKAFHRTRGTTSEKTSLLAELFKVSHQAMRIRLTEIGLRQ